MAAFGKAMIVSAMAAASFAALAQTPPTPPARPPELKAEPSAKDAPVPAPRPEHLDRKPADAGKAEAPKADASKPDALKPEPLKPAGASEPTSATAAGGEAAEACLAELAALGAEAQKAEAPSGDNGCAIETPVRLKTVTVRDARIVLHGEPLISCAAARAAALYLAQNVAPLAKGATGQTLSGITASGFECRPRNRQAGGKLSAHGKGMALDIMSFQFADGSSMSVSAPGERQGFLNGARKAACGYFTTVLGPGSDAAHADHLHLDIEPHGASGYGRICQ